MKRTALFTLLLLLAIPVYTGLAMDFDDLFFDDIVEEQSCEQGDIKPEEILLSQEGWELGGSYNFSINISRLYIEGMDPRSEFKSNLAANLYLDARPTTDCRFFSKFALDFDVAPDPAAPPKPQLEVRLQELFADFNHKEKIFFRAGKQNVKWGVGYFYSPADVINVGRLDPVNPEGEREGPVTLKVHYPRKSNNYYLCLLFDGVRDVKDIALAAKLEYLIGRSEIGLGGFYKKDKAPRLMATVSSCLGGWSLFGETVVSKGSDKLFFEGGQFVEKGDWFFHATAGTTYAHNDPEGLFDISGTVQYFFDGEGTGIFEGRITSPKDKHRLALALNWHKIYGSKFSASLFTNTNLSDKSGLVMASLSLPKLSSIVPRLSVGYNFGDTGTEFSPPGKDIWSIVLTVSLGNGSF